MEFAHDETVALADQVRVLIEAVRLAAAPPEALQRAAAAVASASAELADYRFNGVVGQASLDAETQSLETAFRGDPNQFFPYSPIVGPLNPLAPPVDMWVDEQRHVHGRVTLDAPYNGPPNLVHGGIIALIFDELLGACAVVNECPGFTGTLTVKYLRGTPIRSEITMRAWVESTEGRKTNVSGEIYNGEVVTAVAKGIFISTANHLPKQ